MSHLVTLEGSDSLFNRVIMQVRISRSHAHQNRHLKLAVDDRKQDLDYCINGTHVKLKICKLLLMTTTQAKFISLACGNGAVFLFPLKEWNQ